MISWLADAPLFIDAKQVAAFYDAVVQPESEKKAITLSLKKIDRAKLGAEGKVAAEASVVPWIKAVFPFLDAKLSAEAAISIERDRTGEDTETVELQPIRTPQRQLVQLALHYGEHWEERIALVRAPEPADCWTDDYIQQVPRSLLFLDLPRKSPMMPTAAELPNGRVLTFYDKIQERFSDGGQERPKYPDPTEDPTKPDVRKRRQEYWEWYTARFDPVIASRVVEEEIGNQGRVRWIDYRLPLSETGPILHMHICGNGEYDTGTFAYNLIKRGFKHGARLVGTLKSEPDMNVLAIFEK